MSNEEEKLLVQGYRKIADPIYVDWAINEVVNWKNSWQPENLVHIHGDKDKITSPQASELFFTRLTAASPKGLKIWANVYHDLENEPGILMSFLA